MILSLLSDIVTFPLNATLRATKAIVKSQPFASVFEGAVSAYQGATPQASGGQLNALETLFGITAGNAASLAHLRNFIRDAAKQQLTGNTQFDETAFQNELAVEMRQLGFDDATIKQMGTSLTGVFAEMRGLSPAMKHDLLEMLDGSMTDETVTPSADAGLMQ